MNLKLETGTENNFLRTKSVNIDKIDKKILKLIKSMKTLMLKEKGIGLAAPQVGKNINLFVFLFDTKNSSTLPKQNEEGDSEEDESVENIYKGSDKKIIACINPRVTHYSKEKNQFGEGCLSLPKDCKKVSRPQEIAVEFLDEKNKQKSLHLKGINARVFQHEFDHLNGVLFTDY